MESHLLRYFAAEKREALLFAAVGASAIAAAAILWVHRSPLRSMGVPLVLIAIIQLSVGAVVYARTDGQVGALHQTLARSPATFRRVEVTRMMTVQRWFLVYKLIEIGLIVAGALLAARFHRSDFLYGIALGLVIQGSQMLVLDLFAERRGAIYLDAVRALR